VNSGTQPSGRHERGATLLGDPRARHLLRDWHGGRAAPYPMLVRDFQAIIGREARASFSTVKGDFRTPARLHRRWLQCHGAVPPVYQRRQRAHDGVEAAGSGSPPANMRPASVPAASRAARHKTYLLQDEDGQIAHAHSSRPGLTTRGRPSMPISRKSAAPNTLQSPTTGVAGIPLADRTRRDHAGTGERPCRGPGPQDCSTDGRDQAILVCLSGRATRISTPWPPPWALNCRRLIKNAHLRRCSCHRCCGVPQGTRAPRSASAWHLGIFDHPQPCSINSVPRLTE